MIADGQSRPLVGLAYGPAVPSYTRSRRDLVDYIEVPYEQLARSPVLDELAGVAPIILHCASMSIAGFVPPPGETVEAIAREAVKTRTPWIGEHLAFVGAEGLDDGAGAATWLTYTVCPQLSEETVERVAANLAGARSKLPVPLILENSPQYMHVPGSTMGMVDFIAAVCERADVDLLLDLSHFLITCRNTGNDEVAELRRFPVERVTEVHLSGLSKQSGITWDDHAVPAPERLFELLGMVLERKRPRAVTLEYNWSPSFPVSILDRHLDRIGRLVGRQ